MERWTFQTPWYPPSQEPEELAAETVVKQAKKHKCASIGAYLERVYAVCYHGKIEHSFEGDNISAKLTIFFRHFYSDVYTYTGTS